MFMRKMRDSAKYVMLVLTIAFVGWLVFEGINDMRGGGSGGELNPVVAEVAGRDIRYGEWNEYLQSRLALARQSGRSLTEEDVRVLTEGAWESLIGTVLLQAELERLGVEVTDSEIRQAFLTQPPSELYNHPAFQTDGQFDVEKYRRFFTDPATDENTLLQIESYYRSLLPRNKLEALVRSGTYVSEADAWEFFKDTNERARVRFVRIDPGAAVPDSAVTVTDAEIRAYYNEHRDDFSRPASARTNMVSFALRPSAADTAVARARAETLRARVEGGEDFAEVARAESGDPNSAPEGGDMGRRARANIDPALADVAFELPMGSVSEPVETSFGFHLLRVDSRTGDSISMRQIYVPVEVSDATEDSIFDLMDELEEIALRTDLVTAADSVGLPVRTDVTLTDGVDFIPGAGALGVAPDWTIDPETQIGDLSQFFENATGFHVFELLGRQAEGTAPLADVSQGIRQTLATEKKKERARERARELVETVDGGQSLDAVAAAAGATVEETGAFRRGDFVPGLGQGTEAIGAAFGLPVGRTSGVVDTGDAVAVIEVVEREEATRGAFEEVKEILLEQLAYERTQQYVQRWLSALREQATVEDHRERLRNPDAAS